jgi:hypothetical protein
MKHFIKFVAVISLSSVAFSEMKKEGGMVADAESGQLIRTLSEKSHLTNNPTLVAESIKTLGRRRDVTAIPVLIEVIDFRDPNYRIDYGRLQRSAVDGMPSIEALHMIGKASLQSLLEAIKSESSPHRLWCMAAAITLIQGQEQAVKTIDSAIAETKDQAVIKRLRIVRKCIVEGFV